MHQSQPKSHSRYSYTPSKVNSSRFQSSETEQGSKKGEDVVLDHVRRHVRELRLNQGEKRKLMPTEQADPNLGCPISFTPKAATDIVRRMTS